MPARSGKPKLARKLVFEHFQYGARDVDEGSSEADILARKILQHLESVR